MNIYGRHSNKFPNNVIPFPEAQRSTFRPDGFQPFYDALYKTSEQYHATLGVYKAIHEEEGMGLFKGWKARRAIKRRLEQARFEYRVAYEAAFAYITNHREEFE